MSWDSTKVREGRGTPGVGDASDDKSVGHIVPLTPKEGLNGPSSQRIFLPKKRKVPMPKADLYTKLVLTIIALCLMILCVQSARWNRIETVHADGPQQVTISGFVWHDAKGKDAVVLLGSRLVNPDYNPAIPVFTPPEAK